MHRPLFFVDEAKRRPWMLEPWLDKKSGEVWYRWLRFGVRKDHTFTILTSDVTSYARAYVRACLRYHADTH